MASQLHRIKVLEDSVDNAEDKYYKLNNQLESIKIKRKFRDALMHDTSNQNSMQCQQVAQDLGYGMILFFFNQREAKYNQLMQKINIMN